MNAKRTLPIIFLGGLLVVVTGGLLWELHAPTASSESGKVDPPTTNRSTFPTLPAFKLGRPQSSAPIGTPLTEAPMSPQSIPASEVESPTRNLVDTPAPPVSPSAPPMGINGTRPPRPVPGVAE